MPERTCTVPKCSKPTRSAGSDWCKMHYHRWYRHGDVNVKATASVSVSKGRRYRSTHRPDHPLAKASGRVYVHMIVLYDAIGPGVHPCHWCSRPLRWEEVKGAPGRLTVDHLDGQGDNNVLANLVPSCGGCNTVRAVQARSDALREAGWWSNHDTVAALNTRKPRICQHAE